MISNVVRPPTIRRLSTSRPIESVPSQCWALGPARELGDVFEGSNGAISGAKTVTTISTVSIASPRPRSNWPFVRRRPAARRRILAVGLGTDGLNGLAHGLDPRIDPRIGDVDQHVDQDDDACSQHRTMAWITG